MTNYPRKHEQERHKDWQHLREAASLKQSKLEDIEWLEKDNDIDKTRTLGSTRKQHKRLNDAYWPGYRYEDSMDNAPQAMDSVYYGHQYGQASRQLDHDSGASSHTDDKSLKAGDKENSSNSPKARGLPECHYETRSLFQPMAAAQTSDVQYSSFSNNEVFERKDYENQGYDSLGDYERFPQEHSFSSQERYVDVQIDARERDVDVDEGNDDDDNVDDVNDHEDDDDDDNGSIFKLSNEKESPRFLDSSVDIDREQEYDAAQGKFKDLYKAFQDVNRFLKTLDTPVHEDELTTMSAAEIALRAHESNVKDREPKDGIGNVDKANGNQDEGNSWVKISYKQAEDNSNKTSGLYKDSFAHKETTTVVLPYRVAAHMRKKADVHNVTPAAKVMLAGMEQDASFARLVL